MSRPGPIPGQDRSSGASPRQASVPATRSGASAARLPALLAALCERLTDDRCVALERALQAATGPDDARVGRFVADEAAAGLAGQLRDVVRAWRAEAPGLTGAGLALALATARSLPRPEPAQVVVSGPLGASVPARLTSGVAVEVIQSAATSLLIASFAAHGARDVVREISRAVSRGVHVDLLLEESTQAADAFAALPHEVHVWHRAGAGGVLHAKLIAADRHTAFLGSANLTDRALSDNIELGVLMRDPKLVHPLVDHFRWLLAPENDLMRRA